MFNKKHSSKFKILLLIATVCAIGFSSCKDDGGENGGGHIIPIDTSKKIPAIYIVTEGGKPIDSKTTYVNATFRMDGRGVFGDIEETNFRIRGRGNST
jgi:hypothetical protein